MIKISNVFLSTLESMANWASGKSMWPLACGLSCCAIEMMHAASSRIDLDRFGCLFRSSPRHADLLIVAGTVTKKMLPQLLTLYEQMLSPKYVIAMGSCAICGGLYAESESVVNNLGDHLPINMKVQGCPPRPEDLARAIYNLQSEKNR
ncbi:MAG: NADH-quinone oxidoreductase subunit NuoB [Holosporales bacterium]|nr:NADH-quinone oxidoreductase subunit NuoB [Holosporales bacterium]